MCKRFAVAAVAFKISPSSKTNGAVNNSTVVFAPTALTLNKLKTAADALVSVNVSVSALPLSSEAKIDLKTAVVALGQVYKVVAFVVVKSNFAFLKLLANKPTHCLGSIFRCFI